MPTRARVKTKRRPRSRNVAVAHRPYRKPASIIIALAAVAVCAFLFLSQSERFQDSFLAIKFAQKQWVLIGVGFSAATYFAAAGVYCLIAYRPLNYGRTLLLQLASSFTNRLLPAGAGGLTTYARYLVKHRHTQLQAGSLAAFNNLIGLLGHFTVLILVMALSKTPPGNVLAFKISPVLASASVLIAASVLAVLVLAPSLRRTVLRGVRSIVHDSRQLARRPARLLGALLLSMAVTSLYALTLYACTIALGVHVSVLQVFIVFTAGIAAASVTPTPGGIGGAEAGLVAAFVSVGVAAEQGLPVALVYRFIIYWLPLLPGFIAFQIALRKKYI